MFTRSLLLNLACIACLPGCVTYMPITTTAASTERASLHGQVSPGDKIRVHLRDGTVVKLDVISIESDKIVGDRATLKLSGINTVERRQVNVVGTTMLIGGAVLLFGIYETEDSLEDTFGDLNRGT